MTTLLAPRPAAGPHALRRALRLGRPLRAAARLRCARSVGRSVPPITERLPSPTTTRSSTAPRPTAPVSAGSARTPTCSCPGGRSWFLLGCVVTDRRGAPEAPLAALVADGCGTRERCILACPTGAIVALPRPLDARRCLSWTLQIGPTFPPGPRVARWGIASTAATTARTVSAQSGGSSSGQRPRPPVDGPRRSPRPGMVPLRSRCSPPPTKSSSSATVGYIAKRDPRYLRRNALVILAVGDGGDPQVNRPWAALARPIRSCERTAVWSARRPGCDDLLVDLADDPDPQVRDASLQVVGAGARRVKHLLVTNDFLPKIGGIQSYLREGAAPPAPATRRRCSPPPMPARPPSTSQSTDRHRAHRRNGSHAAHASLLVRRIDGLAERRRRRPGLARPGPAPRSPRAFARPPNGLVLHGAEVTVPGRGARGLASPWWRTLRGASPEDRRRWLFRR